MKKWVSKNYSAQYGMIAQRYHISEVLAQLLVKRGLFDWESMERFLFPELTELRDAGQMKDFWKAVRMIEQMILEKKRIKVVGDYDVDGITSTYIFVRGIRLLGGNADSRIPHRVKDGYGMRDYMAEEAYEEGYDMLLTCDNGISAYDAIARAKELGLFVVVTDHHEVPKKDGDWLIPPADAVVDPKQADCSYPFKELCGAGIAFKVMSELFKRAGRTDAVEQFLPFAAIATICDVVPLKDENRILVKNGLELLEHPQNTGLHALIKAQGFQRKIGVGEVGFRIGPCINAAGRLADAKTGLELFLEEDAGRAAEISAKLVLLNEERKRHTSEAEEKAVQMIEAEDFAQDKVYVVLLENCHESIAGIVAGRLKERYYHPVIVLTRGERGLKGSGRSIPGYHMQQELNKCSGLLIEFGGHALAAGLSVEEKNFEALYRKLNENCTLSKEDFVESVSFDMELPLGEVDEHLVQELSYLEPFGQENNEVLFAKRGLRVSSMSLCGQENQIARLRLDEGGAIYSAVDFRCELHLGNAVRERYGEAVWEQMKAGYIPDVEVDILYCPQINERYGGIDFKIVDCR